MKTLRYWLAAFAGLALVTTLVTGAVRAQQAVETKWIFEAIGIKEGATVCEIGAGDGELTIDAAKVVGASGRIYSSELGEERVNTLRRKVADSGLQQITVIEGSANRTNFPDATCDGVFMRNVYHHFGDPPTMNASILAALKPGGRLAIVDFSPPKEEAPTAAERGKDGMHGVKAETVAKEAAGAGFETISTKPANNRWFLVVMQKPVQQ
jgi:ubiquinone/menaquinone biosynthesis C-methylase UbiE